MNLPKDRGGGSVRAGARGCPRPSPRHPGCPMAPLSSAPPPGYPDHMVFAEFRRRFDVLAPHLTKKHGRNYIVVDEKRVRVPGTPWGPVPWGPAPCS